MNRIVSCSTCKKEIEVRWGIFAHHTLKRHENEHPDFKEDIDKEDY
jgi:hypothetical protein